MGKSATDFTPKARIVSRSMPGGPRSSPRSHQVTCRLPGEVPTEYSRYLDSAETLCCTRDPPRRPSTLRFVKRNKSSTTRRVGFGTPLPSVYRPMTLKITATGPGSPAVLTLDGRLTGDEVAEL